MRIGVAIPAVLGVAFIAFGCAADGPISPTDVDVGPQQLVGAPGAPVEFEVDLGGLGPGIPINPGECISFTGDGMMHFNHCIFLGPIRGDLENPAPDAAVVILTGVQDAEGGSQGQGSFTFTATWHSPSGDLTGTLEGNLQLKGTLYVQAGKLHGRGTAGDLLGLQMWGDVQEQGDPPGTSVAAVTGAIR